MAFVRAVWGGDNVIEQNGQELSWADLLSKHRPFWCGYPGYKPLMPREMFSRWIVTYRFLPFNFMLFRPGKTFDDLLPRSFRYYWWKFTKVKVPSRPKTLNYTLKWFLVIYDLQISSYRLQLFNANAVYAYCNFMLQLLKAFDIYNPISYGCSKFA